MCKWILIEPMDTLFFRDGRPFWRGEETFALSFFPPTPRTFYGAIRTAIIFQNSNLNNYKNCEKIKIVVGNEENFGNLKIYGPLIYGKHNNNLFFNLPRDIVKKDNNITILNPVDLNNCRFNLDFNVNLVISENLQRVENLETEYISDYYLCKYIRKDIQELNNLINEEQKNIKMIKTENKVGIKLNKNSGNVEEGYLYSSPHIRLDNNYSFVLGIEDDNNLLENEGYFRLGGDTRAVRYSIINLTQNIEKIKNGINESLKNNNKRFKVVLLTYAIFKNGWYPDFLKVTKQNSKENKPNLEGLMPNTNIEVKLIGCILGKPKCIGGFDLAKKYPKPIVKAVPPGSVYYFEVLNNDNNWKDKLINDFSFKSILDNNLSKEGFGQILIGGW